jgi:hypothetical protein
MAIKLANVVQAKAGTATYTTTTAKPLFNLPSGAMITGVKVVGTASNAATTGVLTLRNVPRDTGTAATFCVLDVKSATGVTGCFAITAFSGVAFNRVDVAQTITATYTETGTAASAGSWTVVVEYI